MDLKRNIYSMAFIPLKNFLCIRHFKLIGLIGPRAVGERVNQPFLSTYYFYFYWEVTNIAPSPSQGTSGQSLIYAPCSLTNENLWNPCLGQPDWWICCYVQLLVVAGVALGIIGVWRSIAYPLFSGNRLIYSVFTWWSCCTTCHPMPSRPMSTH